MSKLFRTRAGKTVNIGQLLGKTDHIGAAISHEYGLEVELLVGTEKSINVSDPGDSLDKRYTLLLNSISDANYDRTSLVISDPGDSLQKAYTRVLGTPVGDGVNSVITPFSPDKVILHDDDLLLNTDLTTEAISFDEELRFWRDSYDTDGSSWCEYIDANGEWLAQTFTTGAGFTVTGVGLLLSLIYTSPTLTVSIQGVDGDGHPDGSDLCSGTVSMNDIYNRTSPYCHIKFSSSYALSASTQYALVVKCNSLGFSWWWEEKNYYGGVAWWTDDGGSTWNPVFYDEGSPPQPYPTFDFLFRLFSGDINEVPCIPVVGGAVGDGLYIGNATQFHTVEVLLWTPGVGTWTVTPKYWDGAYWTALTNEYNETSNWITNTWYLWHKFTIPVDWAQTTILSTTLYYIKYEITAFTSMTTVPRLSWVQIEDS